MPQQDQETKVEVTLTIPELHAVVKSLSIGYDQLQGKIQRLGQNHKRSDDIHDEAGLLLSAKQEMELVLQEATRRENAVT